VSGFRRQDRVGARPAQRSCRRIFPSSCSRVLRESPVAALLCFVTVILITGAAADGVPALPTSAI